MDYSKFRTSEVTEDNIKFWIKNKKNVLLFGKHGVGKSSLIMEGFESNGLVKNKSYAMFSGSTLDPWIDFIGIPRESKDSGSIEFIRPEYMNEDLEAIFMDEYNRAPKAVRNALMELSQFKSINGKKFPNLKMVWAACNPETGDYDTELLDPAQGDRFHVILNLPYSPNLKYFKSKYGDNKGENAVTWWNDLPEDSKEMVSPRRLDYAVAYHLEGGDVREILPINSNVADLKRVLNTEPLVGILNSLLKNKNWLEVKKILNDSNNLQELKQHVFSDEKFYPVMANYVDEEFLTSFIIENDSFFEWSISKYNQHNRLLKILNSINDSKDSSELSPNKYKIMEKALNYNKLRNTFLVLDPYAPKSVKLLNGKNPKKPRTNNENVLKITKSFLNDGKAYIKFEEIHNALCLNYKTPKELSNEALISILFSYVKRIKDLDYIIRKDHVELLNVNILEAHNRGILDESDFYNDFKEVIDRVETFIVKESDMIDVGDVLLNTTGFPSKEQFYYED